MNLFNLSCSSELRRKTQHHHYHFLWCTTFSLILFSHFYFIYLSILSSYLFSNPDILSFFEFKAQCNWANQLGNRYTSICKNQLMTKSKLKIRWYPPLYLQFLQYLAFTEGKEREAQGSKVIGRIDRSHRSVLATGMEQFEQFREPTSEGISEWVRPFA